MGLFPQSPAVWLPMIAVTAEIFYLFPGQPSEVQGKSLSNGPEKKIL
jgi:hypothetical protein